MPPILRYRPGHFFWVAVIVTDKGILRRRGFTEHQAVTRVMRAFGR